MNGAVKTNELGDMTQRDPERLEIWAKRSENEFPLQKKMQPNIPGEIQLKMDTKILILVYKSVLDKWYGNLVGESSQWLRQRLAMWYGCKTDWHSLGLHPQMQHIMEQDGMGFSVCMWCTSWLSPRVLIKEILRNLKELVEM